MSKFHTNLKVSQKIHSLGVKAESEKIWFNFDKIPTIGMAYDFHSRVICPAYSLSELADVLREVGKIKRWGGDTTIFNFREVCETFYCNGVSAANKYLEEII
jgi:hypothetical protein